MGALDGLKILDFSTLLPGPFATMVLADLGADVLRVTAPGRDDLAYLLPPLVAPAGNVGSWGAYTGRNKRAIAIDLTTAEGVEIVKKLVQSYDIVLDQFRPGVMDRLGVGYEALREVNPSVVYVALTGYGQTGPMRLRAGHDINYLAASGAMSYSGRADTGPISSGMQIADVGAGSMNTIIGLLVAAWHRRNTGEGQYVDVSMLDGVVALMGGVPNDYLTTLQAGEPEEPTYADSLLNGGTIYDFYQTRDGRYLSVGALEPKFFAEFCQAIGHEELIAGGVGPRPDLDQAKQTVREAIQGRTLAEWTSIFAGLDACTEPVLTISEALESDQLKDRQMVVEVPNTDGSQTALQIGSAIKFSRTPAEYRVVGHKPGSDLAGVMSEIGYSAEEYEPMVEAGILK